MKQLKPKFDSSVAVVIVESDATILQVMIQNGKNDFVVYAVAYIVTHHQAGASFAALSLENSPVVEQRVPRYLNCPSCPLVPRSSCLLSHSHRPSFSRLRLVSRLGFQIHFPKHPSFR